MALVFEPGWSEHRDLPHLSFITNTASVFFVPESVAEANWRDFEGGWIRSFTQSSFGSDRRTIPICILAHPLYRLFDPTAPGSNSFGDATRLLWERQGKRSVSTPPLWSDSAANL